MVFLSSFLVKLSKSLSSKLNISRKAWSILTISVSFYRISNSLSDEINLFWHCSSPLTRSRNLVIFLHGFVTCICSYILWLLAVMGVKHEADDTYSIRSIWCVICWTNFLPWHSMHGFRWNVQYFTGFVHYFLAHFSGCWASFVYSCHYILEYYNLFSGVKLSIRSFCFII